MYFRCFSALRAQHNTPYKAALIHIFLIILFVHTSVQAAAPARPAPYAESICNTDPNIFFCEDFEGEDIIHYGNGACDSSWGNPAVESKDICWAGGGSYQYATENNPPFGAGNRVWRVSKSQSFTDIVTGINTGTGSGTLGAWLDASNVGSGAREWYARMDVWFSSDHTWPEDLDFKVFFALPKYFIDPPSAPYEAGIYFHEDFFCSSNGNYNDVPVLRYSSGYRQFPYQDEYCPPLNSGAPANGTNAPRIVKGRWYTLEYHVKLAANNTGILELWVDGTKAYSTNRVTCHNGCPDMNYIMILGWMNGVDPQTGYFEIDNVIMSRSYIGPAGGGGGGGGGSGQLQPPNNLRVTDATP